MGMSLGIRGQLAAALDAMERCERVVAHIQGALSGSGSAGDADTLPCGSVSGIAGDLMNRLIALEQSLVQIHGDIVGDEVLPVKAVDDRQPVAVPGQVRRR